MSPDMPADLTVVIPLRALAGRGEHRTAMNTARAALTDYATRAGGVPDWSTLRVTTGPLTDVLHESHRDDLAGLRVTARIVAADEP